MYDTVLLVVLANNPELITGAKLQFRNLISKIKTPVDTFSWRIFNQEVPSEGTYVGFGEWCGVTGLFGMKRAAKTILMEPDRFIFDELMTNVRLNVEKDSSRKVYVDPRCISDTTKTVTMQANGGSGSSIILQESRKSSSKEIEANCVQLEQVLRDYGVVKSEKVFLKIDTEGAESSILPSLTALIKQFDTKPTVLVSMHATGTDSQRQQMADFLNMYPHYVIFPGRQEESRVSNREGMDDGQCEEGVVLFENDGSRFDGGEICDWCDYLVVHDNRASQEKCGFLKP